jgi:hypothetical protein
MTGGRQAGGPRSIATPNPKINNEKGYDNRRAAGGGRGHSDVSIFVAIVGVIRLMKKLWRTSCTRPRKVYSSSVRFPRASSFLQPLLIKCGHCFQIYINSWQGHKNNGPHFCLKYIGRLFSSSRTENGK